MSATVSHAHRNPRYTKEQISFILAATERMSFCDAVNSASINTLMNDFEADLSEAVTIKKARRLLFKLYEEHTKGEWLTKTEACRYIASLNRNSCSKYVEKAKSLGFFHYKRSPVDKRKIYIVPSDQLIHYVESEIDKEADSLRFLVLEFLQRGPMPTDNKPLNGLTLEAAISPSA